MTLSIDTNVAVDLMRRRRTDVRERYERARGVGQAVVISTVVLAELTRGIQASERPQVQASRIENLLTDIPLIPFDAADARSAGAVRHQLQAPGRPIGIADVFIGAQALHRGWTVVTNDVGHFGRIEGLEIVDWRVSDEPLTPEQIAERLTASTKD